MEPTRIQVLGALLVALATDLAAVRLVHGVERSRYREMIDERAAQEGRDVTREELMPPPLVSLRGLAPRPTFWSLIRSGGGSPTWVPARDSGPVRDLVRMAVPTFAALEGMTVAGGGAWGALVIGAAVVAVLIPAATEAGGAVVRAGLLLLLVAGTFPGATIRVPLACWWVFSLAGYHLVKTVHAAAPWDSYYRGRWVESRGGAFGAAVDVVLGLAATLYVLVVLLRAAP